MYGLVAIFMLRLLSARAERPVPPAGRGPDPCVGPATGLPPRPLPTAQDVLLARLLAGAISRAGYRAAMARLAAEDDQAHPVPPI